MTWEVAHAWSARPRCIRWWRWGRAENSGSGDMERSVAEKGFFSTLAGKLTKKTLARVYVRVVGGRDPGLGTPGFLLYAWRDFPTLGRSPVCCFSMTDLRALQVRVRRLSLVDHPTCAPLGALSLIGSSNYNHLLFTVSLYRIGVLGFWGIPASRARHNDTVSGGGRVPPRT